MYTREFVSNMNERPVGFKIVMQENNDILHTTIGFIDVRYVAVNIIVTYAGIGIHNYLTTQMNLLVTL